MVYFDKKTLRDQIQKVKNTKFPKTEDIKTIACVPISNNTFYQQEYGFTKKIGINSQFAYKTAYQPKQQKVAEGREEEDSVLRPLV